jgi:Protein of unknown function (DUF2505)
MDFSAEHRFAAPAAEVAALMVDPEFEAAVELPDLALPEVLEHGRVGSEDLLRLRYEFTGHLDAIARRVVGNRTVTLVQEVRLDPGTGQGRLRLTVEADPDRVHGEATIRIDADGDGASVRRMQGTFKVAVPLIGGTAERAILPGVLRRMDVEAAALAQRIDAGPN